jgi:hypothetical protein
VIVVPKEKVADALRDCGAAGIAAAVVITAGFGETGAAAGRRRKKSLAWLAPAASASWGPIPWAFTAPIPAGARGHGVSQYQPGAVALISQSGNLGTSIADRFIRRGIGMSRLVSSGNEADLTVGIIWTTGDGRKKNQSHLPLRRGCAPGRPVIEKVRRVSAVKPVILLKGGIGTVGAMRPGRTGALAGRFAVFRAVLPSGERHYRGTIDEDGQISRGFCFPSTRSGAGASVSSRRAEAWESFPPICAGSGSGGSAAFFPGGGNARRLSATFWSRRNSGGLVAPGGCP